jgi:cutinase
MAHGAQQLKAAAELVVKFPGELVKSWSSFVDDLNPSQFTRLLLSPQHFTYGNNGMAAEAAEWVLGLDSVKSALAR